MCQYQLGMCGITGKAYYCSQTEHTLHQRGCQFHILYLIHVQGICVVLLRTGLLVMTIYMMVIFGKVKGYTVKTPLFVYKKYGAVV